MVFRLSIASILTLVALGCASAPSASARSTTPSGLTDDGETDSLRATLRARTSRVRELEVQLGLAQSEVDEVRDELSALRREMRLRATRIGDRCESERVRAEALAEASPADAPEAPASRPVLRLYGRGGEPPAEPVARPARQTEGVRALPGPAAPALVAAPPPGGPRLPVVGVPGLADERDVPAIPRTPVPVVDAAPTPSASAPAPVPPDREEAVERYRAGLRALTARDYPAAGRAFDAFLRTSPDHPYAASAVYWRAEVRYAERDYAGALRAFARFVEAHPRHEKVPDALLRVGLCHRRMGDEARALRVFEELRARYPESASARMATREDT